MIFTSASINHFNKLSIIDLAPPIQDRPVTPINVCVPSPCGPYSQCQQRGESPSCTCLPNYIGSPPNCRPECTTNSECPTNRACINEKCRDPCPGSCGILTQCSVLNHTPMCKCLDGYTGNPFTVCHSIPPVPSKNLLKQCN